MVKRLSLIFLLTIVCFSCKKEEEQNVFYENLEREKKDELLFNVGKVYFQNNCKGCHRKNGTDNFLKNSIINDKYGFSFFKNFVTNQDSLIKNGNKIALDLQDFSNNQPYRHKFNLNDKELKAIIYYLKK